jgi:2-polyprenyl-6-hydroxyphenyl methylase/3-demethylubiquinone-9 3-methyltransferase
MPGYYAGKLSADRLRACYDLAPPVIAAYLEGEIAFVRQRISRDTLVLELGCGYGRVLREISGAGRGIVGIDTAIESLAMAREFIPAGPRLRLAAMDAARMAFPDRTFDLTICIQNGISAFGVDQPALIREAARVTRQGGFVLFSSYTTRLWNDRLQWFRLQAAHGLIGEIDDEATGDGVIACRDGFRASTVSSVGFASLVVSAGLSCKILEAPGGSLFCEIVAP